MKLYHNPRCVTSRKALDLLKQNGNEPELILYLTNPPTAKELTALLKKLGIPALDLIRKKEAIYKENYMDKTHTNKQWIEILAANPRLIERPIVINGNKALICRLPELVLEII